jgi:polysaccharide export outer membrane protein
MNIFFKQAITAITLLTLSFFSLSAQVSQQQIEQFKKLPAAQQQALAKNMGVDINAIRAQMSSGAQAQQTQTNTPHYPRSTNTDDQDQKPESFEMSPQGELKKFGYDVFANAPQTFAPTMDIAIPSGYIVGPGDRISIQVFGKENNELELEVNREGKIVFPTYGPFSVTGLTFSEMKRFLIAKIKEKVIGVDVTIGMATLRSMRVFVLGDAYKPGPYNLSSLSSITHAIFAAGGINEIGSLRNIQLKRSGKLIKTLDLYQLLIEGDSSNDVLLQSGDVIFVPPLGHTAAISGQVRRPAIYELTPGDDFSKIIKMSGGLLASAFSQSAIIERFNDNNLRAIINVDFTNKQALLLKVHNGDAIKVMKTAEAFTQSITLIGALSRPGKYQWQQGQRITDLLPAVYSHLLAYADLNYCLVIRETNMARDIEVIQFNMVKAISEPQSANNVVLQSNDKILIFSDIEKTQDSNFELDKLAFTQEELALQEINLAKQAYKTKQFWTKYGDKTQAEQNVADNNQESELLNKSIAQLSGGELKKEVNIQALALFSRQRLLLPIIQKLKRQGGTGAPIQLVEIDGQVKFPGVYPLVINAKVTDLIAAAGGLAESAYLARAEISRNQIINKVVTKQAISIDLSDALNLNVNSGVNSSANNNIALKSKDRLNILQIPAWSANHVVELRGEFMFPGKYTIARGEKLSDLIAKAGGFTNFAHQQGSVFTRVQLRKIEQRNLIKLSGDLRTELASKSLSDTNFNQSYTEVKALLADLTKVKPLGRLVLDLPRVVDSNNYDVNLEHGDILYVPTVKNSINVIGQVQVASSHVYDPSLSAHDYLAQSGGSKKRADTNRIYIIEANGSIKMMANANWFSDPGSNMQPGDTVVVPLDSEYTNNLTLWTNVTTILYNSAVAIAAISGI